LTKPNLMRLNPRLRNKTPPLPSIKVKLASRLPRKRKYSF
jgi:hypothetical protein